MYSSNNSDYNESMCNIKQSFPPVLGKNPKLMILGSMPGEISLECHQYYAHPRNAFWRIMGELYGFNHDCDYSRRLEYLKHNNVALWDVLQQCQRQGSLDSSIVNSTIVVNDFVSLLSDNCSIKHIFFNGAKAETEFKRHAMPLLGEFIFETYRLPSTSPAMASLNFEQKLQQWQQILMV